MEVKILAIFALMCMIGISQCGVNDYYDLNRAVFDAQNVAREDPSYYAQYAQDEADNKFIYDRRGNPTGSICLDDDFVPKSSKCDSRLIINEGISAWLEAVEVLSNQPALPALKWSEALSQACYDHIRDIGPNGQDSHTGSDGSSPFDRIDRYATWTSAGENLVYSDAITGVDMISQLIIDAGVPSRGHRDNIYNTDFTHAGVSCGCHTSYTEMCCIAYGAGIQDKTNTRATVAPQLKQCKKYNPVTIGDTSDNFDLSAVQHIGGATPQRPSQPQPQADTTSTQKPAQTQEPQNPDIESLFPGFSNSDDNEGKDIYRNEPYVSPRIQFPHSLLKIDHIFT